MPAQYLCVSSRDKCGTRGGVGVVRTRNTETIDYAGPREWSGGGHTAAPRRHSLYSAASQGFFPFFIPFLFFSPILVGEPFLEKKKTWCAREAVVFQYKGRNWDLRDLRGFLRVSCTVLMRRKIVSLALRSRHLPEKSLSTPLYTDDSFHSYSFSKKLPKVLVECVIILDK